MKLPLRSCGLRRQGVAFFLGLMLTISQGVSVGAQQHDQLARINGGEKSAIKTPRGDEFFLRFISVVSDERCPARVACAWAKPPVIRLEASAPGQASRVFEVGVVGPNGARRGNYLDATIEYADLLPHPQETAEFSKLKSLASYTVVLKIGQAVERH